MDDKDGFMTRGLLMAFGEQKQRVLDSRYNLFMPIQPQSSTLIVTIRIRIIGLRMN